MREAVADDAYDKGDTEQRCCANHDTLAGGMALAGAADVIGRSITKAVRGPIVLCDDQTC